MPPYRHHHRMMHQLARYETQGCCWLSHHDFPEFVTGAPFIPKCKTRASGEARALSRILLVVPLPHSTAPCICLWFKRLTLYSLSLWYQTSSSSLSRKLTPLEGGGGWASTPPPPPFWPCGVWEWWERGIVYESSLKRHLILLERTKCTACSFWPKCCVLVPKSAIQ